MSLDHVIGFTKLFQESSNDGSFDVGGYLVGGFSHEALGGDVLIG